MDICKYIFAYIGFAEINKPVYNACDMLTWDDSYAIALALREQRPNINLEMISLGMIYHWALELEDFQDDPDLANDDVLMAIYQEWFEEVNSL
jgi:FeS assembly protein IscX